MPRIRKFNKRKNVGKRSKQDMGPNKKKIPEETFQDSESEVLASDSDDNTTKSSNSKGKLSDYSYAYEKYEDTDNDFQYDIFNFENLSELVTKICVCKFCRGPLKFFIDNRNGLAFNVYIQCKACGNLVSCCNSKQTNFENTPIFDVNIRLVHALRCIGKGGNAGAMFCGVMNLPTPPRFTKYNKILGSAAKEVCQKTMKDAAEELVIQNRGCRDVTAAFDGSWQRRGYSSLNGITSALSITTGKVIDICIFSKHCRCRKRFENVHNASCTANYSGTSGGMEVKGALDMFRRSEQLYGIRYKYYLGDGDSNAFKSVTDAQPYGEDFKIEKLDCVGHVQKRMGSRLRKLKIQKGKLPLSDGKSIGGRGRLTNSAINDIQLFYGLAIRRNTKSTDDMKKAIWAEYFHLSSTNEQPAHGLCPKKNTWCKYVKALSAEQSYNHDEHTHLPKAVMEEIKPIFRDLSNPLLLKQCLHGGTQNASESLNNIIWSRIPKNVFVSRNTLEFGVHEAVSCYNVGNVTKCLIFEKIGLRPGLNCVRALKKFDQIRIRDAERAIQELQRKCRQSLQQRKRKLEDYYEEQEDANNPAYCAGMH